MVELEQDILENPFASALEAADQREKAKQNQTPDEKRNHRGQKAPVPQSGREAHYLIKDFKRTAADLEAMRIAAKNIASQWIESIEGPIVNPRIQKNAIRAWRPIFTRLLNEGTSEEARAGIIFELMMGLSVNDTGVTHGQMQYLKGAKKRGFVDEDVYKVGSTGVVYVLAVFQEISELRPGERSNLRRFLRNEESSQQSHTNLRIDRVLSRWVGTRPIRKGQ
ncbi:MAG: hypothetical protein G01um10147_125 [Microgenomates group bacterium Gr01-1014_7]|nr:MAG: hypothetical protein G01um10147_125 [Microgenomates group bacterium Gr01-1014_7]